MTRSSSARSVAGLPPLAPVARLAPAVHDGDDLDLCVGHDVDHDAGKAIEHEAALGPALIEGLPTLDVLLDSLERFQYLVIELVVPTGTRAIDATGRVFELDDGGRREPGGPHLPLRRRARSPAVGHAAARSSGDSAGASALMPSRAFATSARSSG